MTVENSEVVAAAASGAAAAVETVQDQQAVEDTAQAAELNATIAAEQAGEATFVAGEAAQTADVAVGAAVQAEQTAEVAGQMAGAALVETDDLRGEVAQIKQEQQAFFTEARGFFASMQDKQEADNGVTEVTVVDHSGADQSGTASDSGAGNPPERPRRHRFGNR
jgi:hypothetical protein